MIIQLSSFLPPQITVCAEPPINNLQLETTEKFTCYIFSVASFILLQYRQDFEGLP